MERRTQFDATVAVSVVSSSLSEPSSAQPLKGTAVVQVQNTGTVTMASPYGIQVFASTVPVTGGTIPGQAEPVGDVFVHAALAPGQTKTYTIKGKLDFKGELTPNTYTLYALFRDSRYVGPQNQIGFYSASPAGPALTVLAPFINLNPTETFSKLPATAASGAATPAVARVAIANAGNDVSSGKTTATVYISADGSPNDGVQVGAITKSIKIAAGKTGTLTVPLKVFPAGLTAGSYQLVTRVTDPNGTATTSTATASVTITPPLPPQPFTATIKSVSEKSEYNVAYNTDQRVPNFFETQTLTVTFANASALPSTQLLTVHLFESESSAIDTAGRPYNATTYTLTLKPHAHSTAKITFPTLSHTSQLGPGAVSFYYVATFTGSDGTVVTARTATPLGGVMF